MPNAANCDDYVDFIKEAFIAPIRSVAVVDDEYPTLDKLLERQSRLESQEWKFLQEDVESATKEKVGNLQQVVALCRHAGNNWMLDVYDGVPMQGTEGQQRFAQRLHHSDLLILDYHLEGDGGERGEMALGIVKQLANVDHFNLVVVHTAGYRSAPGNTDAVLKDVILSLLSPAFTPLNAAAQKKVEEVLDNWNDEDTGIIERIRKSITDLDFLSLLRDFTPTQCTAMLESDYARAFRGIYASKPAEVDISEVFLFKYLLSQIHEGLKPYYNEGGVPHVDWGISGTSNWVTTEKLFVTIVGKDVDARQLPDKLIEALVQWNPHPHKLLMAKLRHELDDKGIAIAADIVGNKYVQAHWLDRLVSAENDALPTEVCSVIEKHWDELASRTQDTLSTFAQKMVACLKKGEDINGIKQRYIKPEVLTDSSRILAHVNSFNCSKGVAGYHLTTGHILKIDQHLWLCLTPACDLVPGQKESKQLGTNMPVKLVRLYDAKTACSLESDEQLTDDAALEYALKVANRNEMLFLNLEGVVRAFSFSSVYGKANPKWEQFFASNKGLFKRNNTVSLTRVAINEQGALELKAVDAEVVLQLRYEYALNLLQKLGATMSRIGLDFAALQN